MSTVRYLALFVAITLGMRAVYTAHVRTQYLRQFNSLFGLLTAPDIDWRAAWFAGAGLVAWATL